MFDPRSLRGRLTLAYVATLVVTLVVFAAAVLLTVDQIQRRALDRELETTARALSLAAQHDRERPFPAEPGRVNFEHQDGEGEHRAFEGPPVPFPREDPAHRARRLRDAAQSQLGQLVGLGQNAAIFAPGGSLLAATAVSIPAAVKRFAQAPPSTLVLTDGSEGDRYYRLAAAPVAGRRPGGIVVVWRGRDVDELLDKQLLLVFGLAIPLVALLGLLGGNAIVREGLRPLHRMADIASEIEAKDLSRRIGAPRTRDELGRLAEAFDRMLDRLQSSFIRERRFTSDASHELRAPLAVLRASADYALLRERNPAEYRRALETILAEADALEAVTRDLLAIARAENTISRSEPVDVARSAAGAADRMSVLATARRIAIERAITPGTMAAGDAAAFSRVAVALLHNALKFAREGGRVEIRVAQENGFAVFEVADDGPGFTPQALRHATERFWRDDTSRTRGHGTGLGLAIAHASVAAMGGSLALANRDGGGAQVSVRLPRYETPDRSA